MKLRALCILMTLGAVPAFAADGSSGCGAGWYLFKNNSLLSSMSRAYTNATFSNTIGMTSGTSNCAKHSIVKNERAADYFMEANIHTVMVEMAQGGGEHLGALAMAMGCDVGAASAFDSVTQAHYSEIFSSENSSAADALQNLRSVVRSDSQLRNRCGGAVTS